MIRKTDRDIHREEIAASMYLPGNVVKVQAERNGYSIIIDRLNERKMRRLVAILRTLLDSGVSP